MLFPLDFPMIVSVSVYSDVLEASYCGRAASAYL